MATNPPVPPEQGDAHELGHINGHEPEHVDVQAMQEALSQEDQVFVASQWQLMWWKFRKHKMAVVGGIVLLLMYLMALFAEFFGPNPPFENHVKGILHPPQIPRFVDEMGQFHWPPFVYGMEGKTDPKTFKRDYYALWEVKYPVKLFVRSYEYKILGLIPSRLHLFGTDALDEKGNSVPIFFAGADMNGRCLLSRAILAARVSLTIGLLGVFISLFLGILLGGISGYFGGVPDLIIQRAIEFIRSIPRIPLWMSLSAAMPVNWDPLETYFAITILLAIIGWTGLARVVRGRFLALREDDFVMAARLAGSSEMRIIGRHMVPSMTSHLIASLTLSVPGMILGETSLSFLGLGLRPPIVSWGVLLNEGQSIQVMALTPWLAVVPMLFILVTVLAFNFLGDGMRDAADPYGR
jgi:peptide/nickel transport system permease protein